VLSELPATVPVALTVIVTELWNRRRVARGMRGPVERGSPSRAW
jgi:hypothetical protein